MKHLARPFALLIAAASASFLVGCEATLPKAQADTAPPLMTAAQQPKSLVEMQHELDKAAMEIELTKTMALIKFADQSQSPFAMGLVSGLLSGDAQASTGTAPAQRPSFAQLALQQQQHAAEIDLRKAELAERSSWFNRGLQLVDRVVPIIDLTQNYRLSKRQMDIGERQYIYTMDALGGAQRAGYDFGTSVLNRKTDYLLLPHGTTSLTPGLGTSTAAE